MQHQPTHPMMPPALPPPPAYSTDAGSLDPPANNQAKIPNQVNSQAGTFGNVDCLFPLESDEIFE